MQAHPPNERPDAGAPPDAAARSLDRCFAPVYDSEGEPPEKPVATRQQPVIMPSLPASSSPPPAPPEQLGSDDRRLLERLRKSNSVLTVRVNGVELTLDVLDVDRNEHSVCCLIRKSGLKCRIPVSQDVVILLGGEELPVAYLGAWHTIDWLDVHVVVFPRLPQGRPEA